MSTRAVARVRAAAMTLAPTVMLAGFLYHPHIGSPIDPDFLDRLAAAVAADPARWAIAHLLVAVGSGLLILAFLALRGELREAGEERWSAAALPFIVLGSVLYALLPAMEFAPLAAARAGAELHEIRAIQGALFTWFVPTLFTAAVLFLLGSTGFAFGILRSGLLEPGLARVVAAALVVAAMARFVPVNAIQFHVHVVAGLLAFSSLAYLVVRRTTARPDGRRHPASASGTTR